MQARIFKLLSHKLERERKVLLTETEINDVLLQCTNRFIFHSIIVQYNLQLLLHNSHLLKMFARRE